MNYLAVIVFATLCLSVLARTPIWTLRNNQFVPLNSLSDDDVAVPVRCDFHCTKFDLPVCGSNGECMHQFHSPCHMSAYNCKRPQKPFIVIEEYKCEESWAPICRPQQLEV